MMEGDSELWQPLTDRLSSLVEQELEAEEKIRWIGRPLAGHLVRKTVPFVLFGIGWLAFGIFWIAGAGQFQIQGANPAIVFPLIGLPFLMIGMGFTTWPIWIVRRARRTVYVVTDRRAILFEGGARSTTVSSFRIDQLQNLRRVQHDDGSGDLIFEERLLSNGAGQPLHANSGFFAIPDVKHVEELIRELSDQRQSARIEVAN